MMKKATLLVIATLLFGSCAVVKEYEKINLNDPDMALSLKKCDGNLITAHAYRVATVGANGGKTGGGCGCN